MDDPWRSRAPATARLGLLVALVAVVLAAVLPAPIATAAPGGGPAVPATVLEGALERARAATGIPGLQAAVVVDGTVAWTGAAGLAVDRRGIDPRSGRRAVRRSVPLTTATRFSIASVAKVYTATMVLQLVQEGRLGLDDPIARWLAPAPPSADRVTLRELLTHTSGYADVETVGPLAEQLDLFTAYDPHRVYDLARILATIREPHVAPGTRYEYSNVNYLLLGAILLRVAGGTLDSRLQAAIAGPLGLAGTTFADRPGLAGTMAHGYERDGRVLYDHWSGSTTTPTDLVGPVWADGGVVTTAAEAARFGNALALGRILDPPTLAAMTTPTAVSGAERYGMASYVLRDGGRTWNGHDGSYGGYRTVLFSDAGSGLTLAVFANDDGDGVWDAFSALADALRP
jgi:D-alanyl-D-alanine carboxypeptidase